MVKKCYSCKQFKELIHFSKNKSHKKDGLSDDCKICASLYHAQWKKDNPDKIKAYQETEEFKIKNRAKSAKFRKNNPKHNNQYHKERKKTDINFKIACNMRTRINQAIKTSQKVGSAVDDLGCSIPEVVKYLESLFQPGMTWKNWGRTGWHIDHIIPLISFNLEDREQFLKANHYTNLQPLWAIKNWEKYTKIT